MGDVGDYWREHREYKREKARREGTTYYAQGLGHKRPAMPVTSRIAKKLEKLGFKKCSDWHWQVAVDGDLLDYWPSKSKWRYRNETHQYRDTALFALVGKPK